MWPWLTSSASGYQPAANMAHPSTHYVTSQQQQQQQPSMSLPSYPALPHTEYPHSHPAGMGIRYGIPGIGTRPPGIGIGHSPLTTGQAILQSVPDGSTPQGGVTYEDMGGVHRVHAPVAVPSSSPSSSPSLHESAPNQQQQSATLTSPHSSDSRSYHQSPPQLSATGGPQPHPQPPHVGGYMTAAQHAHGSSPFSMDFILRASDSTPGGGSAEAVVPTYGGTSQPPEKGEGEGGGEG